METVSTAVSEEALPSLQGKWVPLEPTKKMTDAGMMSVIGSIGGYEFAEVMKFWRAMLAAAPQGDQVAQLQGGIPANTTAVRMKVQAYSKNGLTQAFMLGAPELRRL